MPIRLIRSDNKSPTIILFYRASCIFSNFYPAKFGIEINGNMMNFDCSEQFFMYQKALSAGDNDSAERILKMTKPLLMKRAGRKLKMDQEMLKRWSEMSSEVMERGIYAKFQQNEDLLVDLLRTRGMLLAEASPRDKVWGIGLGVNNKLSEHPKSWKGSNKLGNILGKIRDDLWEKTEFRTIREIIEKEDVSKRCEKLEKLG